MAKLSLDTSAFLKLYLPEKGANWLKTYIGGKEIIISHLVLFESGNTLARLYREGFYSRTDAITLYQQIERDSANYVVVPLGSQTQLDEVIGLGFNLAVPIAYLQLKPNQQPIRRLGKRQANRDYELLAGLARCFAFNLAATAVWR